MFEALRWRNAQHDAEAVIENAVQSLSQAGRGPILIGSIAAMAILGMMTGMGLHRKSRGRARARAKVMSARMRNGQRRAKRKAKTAAH